MEGGTQWQGMALVRSGLTGLSQAIFNHHKNYGLSQ
jgi:hypothetical protein